MSDAVQREIARLEAAKRSAQGHLDHAKSLNDPSYNSFIQGQTTVVNGLKAEISSMRDGGK